MNRILVLSHDLRLSTQTRTALRALPWGRPALPRAVPNREGWGLVSYTSLPELVVAEHADPILLAKLLDDLTRVRRALSARLVIVVGETADDSAYHMLAPLPLRATVIGPTTFANALHHVPLPPPSNRTRNHYIRWYGLAAPRFVLARWRLVSLLAALDGAATIAQAAEWSGLGSSTAYRILAQTAAQLQLPRRWRTPAIWRNAPVCYYEVRQQVYQIRVQGVEKLTMRNTRPSASRSTTSSEVQTPARSVRTQAEKIRIVQEYDAFPAGSPERGALLRREGVYSSHMARWRKLLPRVGETPAPSPQQFAALNCENERLRLELTLTQARLSQAETVIDVQKKVALLLGQMPLLRSEP